jgi:ribosomal protein L30E
MQKIESALKEGKLVIGFKSVLRAARSGELGSIITSKNYGPLKDKLESLSNMKVEISDLSSKELGILCKKAFSIAVLGVKK